MDQPKTDAYTIQNLQIQSSQEIQYHTLPQPHVTHVGIGRGGRREHTFLRTCSVGSLSCLFFFFHCSQEKLIFMECLDMPGVAQSVYLLILRQSCWVAQAAFKLSILLTQPTKHWDHRPRLSHSVFRVFYFLILGNSKDDWPKGHTLKLSRYSPTYAVITGLYSVSRFIYLIVTTPTAPHFYLQSRKVDETWAGEGNHSAVGPQLLLLG